MPERRDTAERLARSRAKAAERARRFRARRAAVLDIDQLQLESADIELDQSESAGINQNQLISADINQNQLGSADQEVIEHAGGLELIGDADIVRHKTGTRPVDAALFKGATLLLMLLCGSFSFSF